MRDTVTGLQSQSPEAAAAGNLALYFLLAAEARGRQRAALPPGCAAAGSGRAHCHTQGFDAVHTALLVALAALQRLQRRHTPLQTADVVDSDLPQHPSDEEQLCAFKAGHMKGLSPIVHKGFTHW